MPQIKSQNKWSGAHPNCACKCKNRLPEKFNRYQKCRDNSHHGQSIPDDQMKIVVDMSTQTAENYDGTTLSNGRLGVKSTLTPHKFEFPYLNGSYENYGRLGNKENIAQMLNPCTLVLRDDTFPLPYGLTSSRGTIPPDAGTYFQTLDLKRAVLTSEYDASGGQLHVKHEFRALRNAQFVCMSVVEITNLTDAPKNIQPYMIVTKPKHLFNFNYRHNIIDEIDGGYFPPLKVVTKLCVENLYCTAEGPTGKQYASTTMFVSQEQLNTEYFKGNAYLNDLGPKMYGGNVQFNDWDPRNPNDDNLLGEFYYLRTLAPGATDRFVIYHIMTTSDNFPDLAQNSQVMCRYLSAQFPEEVIRRHEEAWLALWDGDIEIKGAAPIAAQDQRDVRLLLYNLYSNIRDDTSLSPGPCGLTSDFYAGHVFWDSETWMLPPMLLLNQNIARSMLEFRWNQLSDYLQNARMFGYRGMAVAWEAASTGNEYTPWFVGIASGNQLHVTGDVAFGFYLFYLATADEDFLRDRACPVICAAADFFATRSEKDAFGKYHIKVVVGPNERNNCYTFVDDNGYTNVLAITILNAAQELIKKCGHEPDPLWKEVADNLVIHKFDGVECNGVTAEIIKNHEMFCVEDCGVKQADTNLISYPLATYPNYQLDNPADKTRLKNNVDFYSALIAADGPAMSEAIFSIIYNSIGEPAKAEEFYRHAYAGRYLPPFNSLQESVGNGVTYFLTGAGGILQSVLFGFGGLRISRSTPGLIYQVPSSLPVGWDSLVVYGAGKDCQTFTVHV